LNHAAQHNMDRVIFVVPYTSIIDQNAKVARDILEGASARGSVVLEHHSNLDPQKETWATKCLGETWDAPVVYTTMVQVLEAMFAGRNSATRRLHTLTNAVIVFDEIQNLPIRCVHLFCNAINFLTYHGGSSVVLCTATQPLLHAVDAEKGNIPMVPEQELMPDAKGLFDILDRVEVIDRTERGQRTHNIEDIVAIIREEFNTSGSCLVIVNTKAWARDLYARFGDLPLETVFFLSTDLCPKHREERLQNLRQRLQDGQPTLCISTQLIEAGVDVDFAGVVRFLAGLDSLAQAAGRCNRNGIRPTKGRVHIVEPDRENLGTLEAISIGKTQAQRVLREFKEHPESYGATLLHPESISRYFAYAFFQQAAEMDYPVKGGAPSLLEQLTCNQRNPGNMACPGNIRHSFADAGRDFQAIDSQTVGVIVPYGEGKSIIAQLYESYAPSEHRKLLRSAQRYSINIYESRLRQLINAGAVSMIPRVEVYAATDGFYDPEIGIMDAPMILQAQ